MKSQFDYVLQACLLYYQPVYSEYVNLDDFKL